MRGRASGRASGMATVGLVAWLAAAAAGAATETEITLEPGEWEFKSVTVMPMSPEPRTTKKRECVTEASADPVAQMTRDSQCEVTSRKSGPGSISWEMVCKTQAVPMKGSGRLSSNGDTAKGEMQMLVSMGQQTLEVDTTWEGRRLGDCP